MNAIISIPNLLRGTLFAVGIAALSLPALAAPRVASSIASLSAHSARNVPAALRPVLYRALARDEGSTVTASDTAAAPLIADPSVWIEQKALADDGQPNDFFGFSVAVSGTTAVIGATQCFFSCNGPGKAYVFTETNGAWAQTAELTPGDGAAGDFFGSSVAIDGDTALVGAPSHAGTGAVYVFTDAGGDWTQAAELSASDGVQGDGFGWSVSLAGTTALVGAPTGFLNGDGGEGAAYVFNGSGNTWNQVQKLTAGDSAANNGFGGTVSLSGTTALVGAAFATVDSHTQQGAAYLFDESGGSWNQTAKLVASDGAQNDWFGWSVSLSGTTALMTAPQASVNGNAIQGAAYVFRELNGTWTEAQRITAADGAAGDAFGVGGAISGDTALIVAPEADVNGHAFQGAAYVFKNMNGTWTEAQKLVASDGLAGSQLGDSFGGPVVAIQGGSLLIGNAYTVDEDFLNGGAAYFYGAADLGLNVSASQTVGQGENYVSQTIATNNASAASPAVSATITVPAAASFVSASASQGSCSEGSGVVTCDFGAIEGNAGTATANVILKATGNVGDTIDNTAGIAKATPPLSASAPTTITEGGACPDGYTEYDGNLNVGKRAHSPIYQAPAGMENAILGGPSGFQLYAVFQNAQGRKIYRIPGNEVHRQAPAGYFTWVVKAGDTGGAYTLCVLHP